MNRFVCGAAVATAALFVLGAQQSTIDIGTAVKNGALPAIAIPDLRGDGQAQGFMPAFNQTLWGDVSTAGVLNMKSKSLYPPFIPQQPVDFTCRRRPSPRPATAAAPPSSRTPPAAGTGSWTGPDRRSRRTTWHSATPRCRTACWCCTAGSTTCSNTASPQVIGKRYLAPAVTEAGARDVAHQFAADIVALFGGQTLAGTHIYFVSDRTGHKEIWAMDYDGKNQQPITHFNSMSIQPAISPDGTKVAFTSYAHGNSWYICVFGGSGPRFAVLQPASVGEFVALVHAGWKADHLLLFGAGRPLLPDLHGEFGWERLPAGHVVSQHRYRAQGQSEDRNGDGVHLRPVGPAADLPDESGWDGYRAADATARAKPGIRPGIPTGRSSRLPGRAVLRPEHATYSSWTLRRTKYIQLTHSEGQEREPELGAGRQAPRVHVHAQRPQIADLVHAGRRNPGAATYHAGQQ